MSTFWDIVVNGLAVGAMYAMGTVALSMIWGSLGILNMAHGAILTFGAYASYYSATYFGLPWWLGIFAALVAGVIGGAALYFGIIHWIFSRANAGINTIIATVAAGALLENTATVFFGAQARPQPFSLEGTVQIADKAVRLQPIAVLVVAAIITLGTSLILQRTQFGRNIRAVSQQRTAAALQGVNVKLVFFQIMIFASVLSAISGVMLTGMTTIYPTVGALPTIKALVICTLAGLGSLWGATAVAVIFGMLEVFVQYQFGSRFGFPTILALAIIILIWRPYGLFGAARVGRV
ncbi:MAG: branched-chain amino acid ABC transporter permease [Roseovarius sp.]